MASTEDFLNTISPSGTLSGISGVGAAAAAEAATAAQVAASEEALQTLISDLAPFKELGTSQIDSIQALSTDPAAQQAFLQNNQALNLQRGVASNLLSGNRAVGDLSAGTQEALENRFLGIGGDLIDQQLNRQLPLLNFGQASAAQTGTGGADLLTGIGDAQAAGLIGAANAQQQGASNAASLAGIAITAFSDPRLKENVQLIGSYGAIGVYSWDWNELAKDLGLTGSGSGHMADEVERVYPDLIVQKYGFNQVMYGVEGKTVRLH